MALPSNITQIAVTGDYGSIYDGTASTGYVEFTAPVTVKDAASKQSLVSGTKRITIAIASAIARGGMPTRASGRRRGSSASIIASMRVVMVTAFTQVGLQCLQQLLGTDREVVQLTWSSIGIMPLNQSS